MNLLRIRLLVLVLGSLAGSVAWADCKLQSILVMPITMVATQPLVTVKLNGTEVHMLMDTGAFFSMLSPQATKRAGLTVVTAPDGLSIRGVGGEARPDKATVQDFEVGGQTLHRVDLLVYGDRFADSGVDGILGQNFLRLANIEIDLANGVARLIKTSGCEHASLAYWAAGKQFGVLDILATDPSEPHVIADAEVNGTPIRVMFDTGASTSHLSLRAAEKAGVTPETPGVVSGGLGFGIGSARLDSYIAPFKSFKLDSEETADTHLRIGDLGVLPRSVDMLLGADFFLSHHVFIDYGDRRVFFTYNGGPVFDLSVRRAAPGVALEAGSAPEAATSSAPVLDAGSYDRRADASLARSDLPAAISDFGLAIAADPGNPQYRLHRAVALARSGDVKQGLSDLDEALRLDPHFTDALMLRASIRARSNDFDGARADFAAAETSAPGRFELQLREATTYGATGHLPLALDVLNTWISAHPGDERMADALGERCLVRGLLGKDLDAALSDCNTARRAASGNSRILYSRGIVRLRRKEYARALGDFNDVIGLQPRDAEAFYARGLARLGSGDKAGGDADLKNALAIDPKVARVFRDVDLGP